MRLLHAALDRRKDATRARGCAGRCVIFSRVRATLPEVEPGRALALADLEVLAVYLRVNYADDATGAIVAEAGDEPTGEVLNALLQTSPIAIATAAWM